MSSINPPPPGDVQAAKPPPKVSALTQASARARRPRTVPFVWIMALSGVSLIAVLIYWMTSSSAMPYDATNSTAASSPAHEIRSSVPSSEQYASSSDGRFALTPTPAPVSRPRAVKADPVQPSVVHVAALNNGGVTDESVMASHVTPPWGTGGSGNGAPPAPAHVAVVYDSAQSGRPYLVATNGGRAAEYAVPPITSDAPAPAASAASKRAAVVDGSDVMVMPDIESTPGPVTIPAGTHIHAILDDGVDSDLQGPVRAHVLDNICDPRTGAVAIPRDAWLLGEEGGTVINGTRHLEIHWTRLTNPDLTSRLLVKSSTLDAEGHSGIAGRPSVTGWTVFRDTTAQSLAGAVGQIATVAVSKAVNGAPVYINGTAATTPVAGSSQHQTFSVDANTQFLLYLNLDFDRAEPYHGRYCGRK